MMNLIKAKQDYMHSAGNTPFPCTACGLCCKRVGMSKETAFLDRGDNICRHFDEQSHLCKIYENRPLVCRVQEYYQTHLTHLYSWQEFIKINQRICKALQTMENSNYFS